MLKRLLRFCTSRVDTVGSREEDAAAEDLLLSLLITSADPDCHAPLMRVEKGVMAAEWPNACDALLVLSGRKGVYEALSGKARRKSMGTLKALALNDPLLCRHIPARESNANMSARLGGEYVWRRTPGESEQAGLAEVAREMLRAGILFLDEDVLDALILLFQRVGGLQTVGSEVCMSDQPLSEQKEVELAVVAAEASGGWRGRACIIVRLARTLQEMYSSTACSREDEMRAQGALRRMLAYTGGRLADDAEARKVLQVGSNTLNAYITVSCVEVVLCVAVF